MSDNYNMNNNNKKNKNATSDGGVLEVRPPGLASAPIIDSCLLGSDIPGWGGPCSALDSFGMGDWRDNFWDDILIDPRAAIAASASASATTPQHPPAVVSDDSADSTGRSQSPYPSGSTSYSASPTSSLGDLNCLRNWLSSTACSCNQCQFDNIDSTINNALNAISSDAQLDAAVAAAILDFKKRLSGAPVVSPVVIANSNPIALPDFDDPNFELASFLQDIDSKRSPYMSMDLVHYLTDVKDLTSKFKSDCSKCKGKCNALSPCKCQRIIATFQYGNPFILCGPVTHAGTDGISAADLKALFPDTPWFSGYTYKHIPDVPVWIFGGVVPTDPVDVAMAKNGKFHGAMLQQFRGKQYILLH